VKVREIQEQVEDTVRKSGVDFVDTVHDHTRSDLHLDSDYKQYYSTKATPKYHDPRGLRKIEHARLDRHFDPQVHMRHRRSRGGKERTRTLVPAASYQLKMYWLFERMNEWREGREGGSWYHGPRVGLAGDNPK